MAFNDLKTAGMIHYYSISRPRRSTHFLHNSAQPPANTHLVSPAPRTPRPRLAPRAHVPRPCPRLRSVSTPVPAPRARAHAHAPHSAPALRARARTRAPRPCPAPVPAPAPAPAPAPVPRTRARARALCPVPCARAHAQPILLFNQGNFMKTSCNPARPSVILKANEAGFSRNVF